MRPSSGGVAVALANESRAPSPWPDMVGCDYVNGAAAGVTLGCAHSHIGQDRHATTNVHTPCMQRHTSNMQLHGVHTACVIRQLAGGALCCVGPWPAFSQNCTTLNRMLLSLSRDATFDELRPSDHPRQLDSAPFRSSSSFPLLSSSLASRQPRQHKHLRPHPHVRAP
jgi:hypothetical protein